MGMTRIQELEDKIERANLSYRGDELEGEGLIVTDELYDSWLYELQNIDPNNPLLTQVGIEVMDEERKEPLPIVMASMNKLKTIEEIQKWFRTKKIPINTLLVASMKYDGAALCSHEIKNEAWTRGNGEVGQRSHDHLKTINRNQITSDIDLYTYGEVIMKRKTFLDKYSEEFSNPRNLVAGQLNNKVPSEILRDCDYVKYGTVGMDFITKVEEFEFLNKNQKNKVGYKVVQLSDLTTESLLDLFIEWSEEYEIDGIILEVNDYELREKLGRETSSNNPCWARAYKGDFEEQKNSPVKELIYEISKKGYLKPVAVIDPISLDGATVTRVTLYNAKYVKDMNIGVGSILRVKRSGMVIPKVVSVIEETGFTLPLIEGIDIEWDENGVELITTTVTEDQRLKQVVSFFEILDVENMGEGIVKQFFENGFDTPKKVLEMTKEDMMKLDKFGVRKANKILKSINDKRNVTLSKLQHASGFFNNLGSKKLLLIEDLYSRSDNFKNMELYHIQVTNEVCKREGFSEISSQNYVNGLESYRLFEEDLKGLLTVSLTPVKTEVVGGSLEGMVFVFSGVRRTDLNEIIENMGGRIASGISSKTSHLVMKSKGTGSAKEVKAEGLGQTILTVEELETLLNV